MAEHNPVRVFSPHTGTRLYVWQDPADNSDTIVPGTDTIAGVIPTGSAKEVHIQVQENSASVFICNVQGSMDASETDFVNLTDALSAGVIAITDASDFVEILQGALYMQPVLSTSTSGDITIRMLLKD